MVNTYTVSKDDKTIELVSKEYVDVGLKEIKTQLINHMNKDDAHSDPLDKVQYADPNIEYTREELDIAKESDKIKAADIETDREHMFIKGSDLNRFRAKVGPEELNYRLDEFKTNINDSIDKWFTKIINNKDFTYNLKNIIDILSNEGTVENLLDRISKCATKEELAEVKGKVLMDKDLENLAVLNRLVDKGFADWNAEPTSINYIKHKPESLPANGGNADTIGGCGPDKLINKRIHELIIGTADQDVYDVNECDLYLPLNYNNGDITKIIDALQNATTRAYIRKGVYIFDDIDLGNNDRIFRLEGDMNHTIISGTTVKLNNNFVSGIYFDRSVIRIGSFTELDHCDFHACTVILDQSTACCIKCCTFDDCEFVYTGRLTNNIIDSNMFHGKKLTVLGNTNIISNNISY